MAEPGDPGEPVGRYQHAFVEGGSYRAAVELVARSSRHDGLVVDLGCGFGAVAEPLAELGLTYVGTDVAPEGLAISVAVASRPTSSTWAPRPTSCGPASTRWQPTVRWPTS